MKLAELIAGLDVKTLTPGTGGVRICDLTEDSRTVLPGSLFVARAGLKADGRKFLADAAHAGAVALLIEGDPGQAPARESLGDLNGAAVLVAKDVPGVSGVMAERFYGEPSKKLKVVTVTGTNGKTTTTFLVWQLLNAVGVRCGLVGTVLIDDGREVAPATMTTPPAIEMSRTLAEMVEAGCKGVALEASSHSLHQKRLDAMKFDAAVFTNLTGDHLDYHQTMEAYADAKARLFEMLPEKGLAVVNAGDAASKRMLRDCRGRVLMARAVEKAGGKSKLKDGDAAVEIVSATMEGMELRLTGPWGEILAQVPLIGTYNAMNVLQAAACCHDLGMEIGQLRESLPKVTAPPGRLERVSAPGRRGDAGGGPSVFVDYAHTDDALRNVLTAVRAGMKTPAGGGSGGKLWVVFGCGGDKDKTKRPRMGAVAAELADRVVVTSDNPRSERPQAIVDQILEGVPAKRRGAVEAKVDRDQAILHAVHEAEARDVIVIAGKGHETEQIKNDGAGGLISLHFDDREVARTALGQRGPGDQAGGGLANRGGRATMGARR